MKTIDMTGKRFGHLTVIKRSGTQTYPCGQKKTTWECKCDCGNTTVVTGGALRSGKSKSCGCSGGRYMKATMTHGETNTRLYAIWCGMKSRCSNPHRKAYIDYGGRGIKVCPEWSDYKVFHDWAISHGYDDSMSIERKNVNGNYCPENCIWIPRAKQADNRRSSLMFTYDGRTQNLTRWAEEVGIKYTTLRDRVINRHWDFDKAISTPVQSHTEVNP